MNAKKPRGIAGKMSRTPVMCISLLVLALLLTKCTAQSKLSLLIHFDKDQWKHVISHSITAPIIVDGQVNTFLQREKNDDQLPPLEPEIDTVNLTWEAGDENFTYWFDNLMSKNKTILYNPLLSIPASGIIPKGPKIFQMSIPCTGKEEGIATLVLGLQIMDHRGRPIKGSPIKQTLRKKCKQFETTTLCEKPCENYGRCNQFGECECRQGYHGKFCEKDMCNPRCENNGTCISSDMCLCLDGFYGKRCEETLCVKPCQNGGRCVDDVCWCTSGYYGGACEFSYCKQPCEHDGLCVGVNKCNCKDGFKGQRCEKVTEREKRGTKKEHKCVSRRNDYKKRCIHKCKKKQEKKASKCAKRCHRRLERQMAKCKKQTEKKKRKKRCKKRHSDGVKVCSKKGRKRRKQKTKKKPKQ